MLPLILGLILFLSVHLVPTSPSLRNGLVERFGEPAYKIGFSALSLIGFVLIVLGYHKLQLMPGKNPVIWDPPSWTRHIAYLLMLPSMILLVAAFVPSRIRSAVKHPMLAAIKAWALAHLLVNGDLGSLVLFGAFLAFAVYDRISIKSRPGIEPPAPPSGPLNDILVVAGGLALFAFMVVWGHGALIGVPVASFAAAP